jgi:hypothetical protein
VRAKCGGQIRRTGGNNVQDVIVASQTAGILPRYYRVVTQDGESNAFAELKRGMFLHIMFQGELERGIEYGKF